jgi:hypothetical protein
MKSSRIIVWACFCVLVMVSPAAATSFQNLVQNGTFELRELHWEFVGNPYEVGVIPPDMVEDLGNPFAYLTNSGLGSANGGYAIQAFDIPQTAATLNLEFDWGFNENGDADPSDDIDEDLNLGDTAFFGVGLIGDVSGFSVVATESTFPYVLPDTYAEIINRHFSQSFDVRGAAGGSAYLIFGALSTNADIYGVSAIDNVTLTATPIPEPSTLLLLSTGFVLITLFSCHKRHRLFT